MSFVAYLSIPLLAAQLVMLTASSCPPDMTQVGHTSKPWCVKKYTDVRRTFCEAVKVCHSNGQEMISKTVYDDMKSAGNIPPEQWWVGLVDALDERDKSKTGWIWIKDGDVTTGTENYFETNEPNNAYNQDCVTTYSSTNGQLRDDSCSATHFVYCYSDSAAADRLTTKLDSGKFVRVEIAVRYQLDPGCWIKEPAARFYLNCAQFCLKYRFGDCIGFYWHPTRRQCVLLPHFDASLPLNASEFSANNLEQMQWTKYLRLMDA